ncbi:MAG: hypothetical protein LAT68_11860 [Cyclobacteriaceae bacterium]|nr:hypothetical protein [Cyclobacteriaceae bacterium]MCH8517011.1 hypothetical protein [Cyclobacteriaceae bacterium]
MMKLNLYITKGIKLIFVGLIFWSLQSCFDRPDFGEAPRIEFNNVQLRSGTSLGVQDTLIVSIDFEDGDGDLGLRGNETDPPFNVLDFARNAEGDTIRFGDSPNLPPFSCVDYEVLRREGQTEPDTFLIIRNENHFNIFVEFLWKRDGENFEVFDFLQETCITFNGRFPILGGELRDRPLQGTLNYRMNSLAFRGFFGSDPIKLRIQIQDRALNRSNTVESPEFRIIQP